MLRSKSDYLATCWGIKLLWNLTSASRRSIWKTDVRHTQQHSRRRHKKSLKRTQCTLIKFQSITFLKSIWTDWFLLRIVGPTAREMLTPPQPFMKMGEISGKFYKSQICSSSICDQSSFMIPPHPSKWNKLLLQLLLDRSTDPFMDNEVKSADIITLKSGQKISCFDLSAMLKRKSDDDDSIASCQHFNWMGCPNNR